MRNLYSGGKSSLRTRNTLIMIHVQRVQWWEVVENIGAGESGNEVRYEVRAFYSERKSFCLADYASQRVALSCLNGLEAAIDNNDLSSFYYLGEDGKKVRPDG